MTPLAGTEEWDEEVVARRLHFLRQCAARHRDLSIRLGRLHSAPEELIVFLRERTTYARADGLESQLLLEAAEIYLVRGDTTIGFTVLREVMERSLFSSETDTDQEYQGTLQQFVMASLLSALMRRSSLRLTSDGAVLAYDSRTTFFNWKRRHLEPQKLAECLPTLLLVQAINGSLEDIAYFLSAGEYGRQFDLVLAAAATKPEFIVLGLFSVIYQNETVQRKFRQLNPRVGFSALNELELGYSTRIELLRSDVFHWKTLRPRAELIDWPLLIAEIALLRNVATRFEIGQQGETRSPLNFIRGLAESFASLER